MASSVSGLTTIDVNTIVSQLMIVERKPLAAMQSSLGGIQTKLSAFGRLQGQLSTFQSAAQALARVERFESTVANSDDTTAVRVSSSGTAAPGSHTLEVDALAQTQALASQPWADAATTIGGGTLRLQFGRVDTGTGALVADAARPEIAITVQAGATLAEVRDAINSAGAGVRASLVTDGSGTRLTLRADETGAANAFSLAVDGDPGLATLAFTPGTPSTTMSQTRAATDALFSIDGLSLTSPGNRLEEVLEGVTLELRRAGTGPVMIDVEADTATMRSGIESFVTAWNDLNRTLADLTRYDAASGAAGALQGNSTAVAVQRRMREILTATVDGAPLQRLADAGLALQRDGSLKIDATRLDAALSSPEHLASLLASPGADAAQRGLARRFDTLISGLLGFDGALSGATAALQSQKDRVSRQQESFEIRMGIVESRLRRQYSALDASLAQWSSASAFLASRFGEGN